MAYINDVDIINISGVPSFIGSVQVTNPSAVGSLATQGVLGSVAVTNFPATQPVSLAGPWTGVGSVYVTTGSVTSTINNLPVGSIYGIGVGSVAVAVISPSTVGSLATQGVIGSVAVSNFPATQSISVSGVPTFIPSGNNYIGTVSGAFSATINSAYIPSGNFYGMGSGTTSFNPIMVESGAAGTPQRVVVAATLSAANVFVQSGNAWAGVGSITGAITGSVAVTNTVTTQPLIGSIYGIGAGSIAAAIISPSTIGSLATQGVIGSVAVTNFPSTTTVNGSVTIIPASATWWHMGSEFSSAQTDTVIIQSGGAGVSHYITDIYFNSSVGSMVFTLEEGTTIPKFKFYGQLAGDGVSKAYTTPMKIGSNAPVTFTTSAAGSVFVNVTGFTI